MSDNFEKGKSGLPVAEWAYSCHTNITTAVCGLDIFSKNFCLDSLKTKITFYV